MQCKSNCYRRGEYIIAWWIQWHGTMWNACCGSGVSSWMLHTWRNMQNCFVYKISASKIIHFRYLLLSGAASDPDGCKKYCKEMMEVVMETIGMWTYIISDMHRYPLRMHIMQAVYRYQWARVSHCRTRGFMWHLLVTQTCISIICRVFIKHSDHSHSRLHNPRKAKTRPNVL